MTRKKYFIILLAALLFAGGAFWYFNVYNPQRLSKAYRQAHDQAQVSHDAGDVEKSIQEFKAALELSPTISLATRTKMELAFSTFTRNKGDDRVRAAEMYKEVINDQQVSRFQRAAAISEFMDLYNGTRDESFARNAIFTGSFASYIQNGDVPLAVRKFYEYADELYPLALVEFRIANWYSNQLRAGNLSSSEKENYLLELAKWTEKGEKNLPVNLANISYETSKIGYIYQMLGLQKSALAEFGNKDYSASEGAFKKGLAVLASEDNVHTYGMSLYLKFNYAAMLARAFGEERKSDISHLLKDVIAPPPAKYASYLFPFYEFLKNETGSQYNSDPNKKNIILLNKLVPEFKNFLDARRLKYQ